MNPFNSAILTASRGLHWSRPCLVWVADYLFAETGRDPAADWRDIVWDESTSKRHLAQLAAAGEGETRVSRALDVIARREGWQAAGENRQGALMVGVYDDAATDGVPALFDGRNGWLLARLEPGCLIIKTLPDRIWEVPRAA